jgi:hypothetical protein
VRTRRFADHRPVRKLYRYAAAVVRVDTAQLRAAETPADVLEAVRPVGPVEFPLAINGRSRISRARRSIAPLPKWARQKLDAIAIEVQEETARRERLQLAGIEVVERKVERAPTRLPKLGKLLNPITGKPA